MAGNTGYGIVRGKGIELEIRVQLRLSMNNPFRYFKTSPKIIRLAVMMYVRFPYRRGSRRCEGDLKLRGPKENKDAQKNDKNSNHRSQ
jgi:hypothetical protein